MNQADQEIPAKVRLILNSALSHSEQLLFFLKTAWKPSESIPTLWLAVTDRRLFLFSTLRRAPVFKSATFAEINEVRSEEASRVIKILFADLSIPDLRFGVAASVSPELVSKCLNEINSRIPPGQAKSA